MRKRYKLMAFLLAVAMSVNMFQVSAYAGEETETSVNTEFVEETTPDQESVETVMLEQTETEDTQVEVSQETETDTIEESSIALPEETVDQNDTYMNGEIAADEETNDDESVLLSAGASANSSIKCSGVCGDNLTWVLSDSGVLTISGTGKIPDVEDPNDQPWEGHGYNILTLNIENGITEIGKKAFWGTDLTSINISDSVKKIGENAFTNCNSIKSVILPNSITTIEDGAFSCCNYLENINIPDKVITIGNDAFTACKFEKIRIPGSATFIGTAAFSDCTNLTSIEVDSSNRVYDSRNNCNAIVETQTNKLIAGCKNTIIPNSITTIGNRAFSGHYGLTSISIPNSVTTIEDGAFCDCKNLSVISLPNSITTIGNDTFAFCENLTNINIPNKVTSIGRATFKECENLRSVVLPESIINIEIGAFSECTNLRSINIPDGVTAIGNSSFYKCSSLTSISIPDSVTKIGCLAFYQCTSLKEVFFYGDAPEISWTGYSSTSDVFEGVVATAHYPVNNSTWTKDVMQDYEGTITWVPYGNTYTVTYDANGGTGTPSAQTKEENGSLILSTVKPSKHYVLKYNANGGSVTPASKNLSCTFTKWNTRKDGKGTAYSAGGSYTANADATLYAQWTNPKAGSLATPEKNGYHFSGWFTSASGGTQITESTTITGNTTIYAHWDDIYNLGDETYSFENYGDSHSPGGHCFGMSITSAGYYNNFIDIKRIGGTANSSLYSFNATKPVKQPICYYQDRQGSHALDAMVAGGSFYKSGIKNISADWRAVVNYVKDHKYDNTGLLQIGFRQSPGGHAINFLRYENVNGEDRIYAYDNNFPDQETYFYKNSSGKVLQAPVQTFSGAIDCICLRDIRLYFNSIGDFDATRVLYMAKDAAAVQGYAYTYMESNDSDVDYVMYEIPEGQDSITIIPKKDNADFVYMDTEYSFGTITDETYGVFKLSSLDESANGSDAVFRVLEAETVTPTITLSKTSFIYTGSKQQPAVTVKVGNTVLKKDQDYSVKYPSGMIDAGRYNIEVTLEGKYRGNGSASFNIYYAAPEVSAVSNIDGGVKVSWHKVDGAEKYRIFRKEYNAGTKKWGTWAKAGDTTALNYTDKTVKSGKKYAYTVRCISSDGKTYTSVYDTVGKSATYVAAPVISSITNAGTGVKIVWPKTAGAAKYRIFRKTGSGSWAKVTDTASVNYTDKTVKNGIAYAYTVRCLNNAGSYISAYNTTGKMITYVPAPTISSLTSTKTKQMLVKWGKNTAATGYLIQYSTSSTFASGNKNITVKGAATVSKTVTNLTAKKRYYVRIRTYKTVSGKNYYSAWSTAKNIVTK